MSEAVADYSVGPWGAEAGTPCLHCGEEIRPDEAEMLVLRADSLEVGRFHGRWCGVAALEWSRPRSPGAPPDLLFMIRPVSRLTYLPIPREMGSK